jgi:LSD1 subclass zinc finger protein
MRKTMKKSSLSSLNCPACGASLSNDPGASSIKCQYCGNTLVFDDDEPGGEASDALVEDPFSQAPAAPRGPRAPAPPQVIMVQSALDPKVQRQVQQAVSRATQVSRVASVLPAIFIFTTLLIGGSIAYFSTRGAQEHQKRVQEQVQKSQDEVQQRQKVAEKERLDAQLKRARDQWANLVEENRNSLPVGLDALFAESLPEGWPTLTKGASSAPVTITWYAAYVSNHEQRAFAAFKAALRKYDQKVKINVIPLPANRGKHTQTLEAMLEILEQKGEGAFEELHERLAQEGRNLYNRGNYTPLCEIMDCDVKKFQKAMKARTHAAKVASLAAVSKKLNLDRQLLFRVQDSLFYDQMTIIARFDDVLEGFVKYPESR